MFILDCTKLPCPQPVIQCRAWLKGSPEKELAVLVDNPAAVANVTSFLMNRGFDVVSAKEGDNLWRLTAKREKPAPEMAPAAAPEGKTLVLITTETLGIGSDELGHKLMLNFLRTLPEMGEELWRIILLNGGVKLSISGPALEQLQNLEENGVSILVCGTCLEHFGLLEAKQVGQTTNMLDVVTSLQLADKIIRP